VDDMVDYLVKVIQRHLDLERSNKVPRVVLYESRKRLQSILDELGRRHKPAKPKKRASSI